MSPSRSQGYGLSERAGVARRTQLTTRAAETNAYAVGFAGEDYVARAQHLSDGQRLC